MAVSPGNNDSSLNKSCYRSGCTSTHDSKLRGTKSAKDQNKVQGHIDKYGYNTSLHGNNSLTALSKGTGIRLFNSKWDHTD